jgi:hypothetical protein
VTIRKLFAAAAVAAGLAAGATPARADEPARKPVFGFSMMKPMPAEAAKAKAAAYLKAQRKFDQAAFDKVWANERRSVLDRTADSLALGSAEAAAMLASVRKANAAPPAEVPAFLADEKLDAFVRTNLALAFAKAAAGKLAYEEALEALSAKGIDAGLAVDPASYFFTKAVAAHATMKKDEATAAIAKLLDDVTDAPARYTVLATLMFFDIQGWPANPVNLSTIEKLMGNSGRRLDLARGGEKTQDIQKKIVFYLNKLIEKDGGDGPSPKDPPPGPRRPGDEPGHPRPGPLPGPGDQGNPAPESRVMGGTGPGGVDAAKLRKIGDSWGTLPPEKRAQVVQELTRDLPPRFEPLIKNYFEALDKLHGYKK